MARAKGRGLSRDRKLVAVVMGDADDSYDFGEVPRIVAKLREGYDLVMAEDGQKGIDLAHSERPDLILLDLGLPDANGLDVARKRLAERRGRPGIVAPPNSEGGWVACAFMR